MSKLVDMLSTFTLILLVGIAVGWMMRGHIADIKERALRAHVETLQTSAPPGNSKWLTESQRCSTDAVHAPYTNDGSECLDRLRETFGCEYPQCVCR